MEARLWMTPNIKAQLSLYNHWHLYEPQNLLGCAELRGYRDFLSFEGCGMYDISPTIPPQTPEYAFSTFRARKTNSTELFTVVIFHHVELQDGSPFGALDEYRRIVSPFVAKFIEAFTTHELGQADLVVVYANYPGAMKLASALEFVKSERLYSQAQLWIQQLLCLLHSVHKAGLALGKALSLDNLIVPVSFERVIVNYSGLPELLCALGSNNSGSTSVQDAQCRDYETLRKIIDAVINGLPEKSEVRSWYVGFTRSLPPRWDYSLSTLGLALLQDSAFDDVLSSLRASLLEGELAKQLENDRLFRIMCKLGFINERQSHAHDVRWSETGDRYILKLFRDHVFHSQDEQGRPIVDFAHVIDLLNKLDVGSEELVMLISRDGEQCIFVTFADVRQKLDAAYAELVGS